MNYTVDPVLLLQKLVQFNSSNPPGNERDCIYFIKELLQEHGISSTIYAKDENRPNLVAKLKGKGVKKPILWYGHVDVVPVREELWNHDPFGGEIVDGKMYGRGTLDMKCGVSMFISAFIELSKQELDFDLTMAIVSDEEKAGEFGSGFLVNEHPELFKGIEYAYGEFGGFPIYVNGKKIYLIQIAEKSVCWLRIKLKGNGGHSAFPFYNHMLEKFSEITNRLNNNKFPIHITATLEKIFEDLSDIINIENPLKQIPVSESKIDAFLEHFNDSKVLFDASLRNTANITVVNCGGKTNVIPQELIFEVDGRILPGETPDSFINELKEIIGFSDLDVEVFNYVPNHQDKINLDLIPIMKETLEEMDPEGMVIPIMLPASTDARHFSQLGIQTYGFIPMNLPEDIMMLRKIHGNDECINIDALPFGVKSILKSIEKYGAPRKKTLKKQCLFILFLHMNIVTKLMLFSMPRIKSGANGIVDFRVYIGSNPGSSF